MNWNDPGAPDTMRSLKDLKGFARGDGRAIVGPKTARRLLGSNPTPEDRRKFDQAFEVLPPVPAAVPTAGPAPDREIPFYCDDPDCWVCAERRGG